MRREDLSSNSCMVMHPGRESRTESPAMIGRLRSPSVNLSFVLSIPFCALCVRLSSLPATTHRELEPDADGQAVLRER